MTDNPNGKIISILSLLPGIKFMVGLEFIKHQTGDGMYNDFHFFKNVNLLLPELDRLDLLNGKVLIKGSRGIALEKTVDKL